MRIIKNKKIDEIVAERLADYETSNGKVSVPVCIDSIIEHCGLSILYDIIEEKPGETIFGGLKIKEKLIVLNEKHMKLFQEKPGLERSTKAHELGHWDIYAKKTSENANTSFDFYEDATKMVMRNSNQGLLSVILTAWIDENVYSVLKEYTNRKGHPYVESAVDRYASCLLMPEHLVKGYALSSDLTIWGNLYRMAEQFGVTISALCVRLQRLNIIYIKDKKIYKSKGEAIGQAALF
jgi:Zn-dependent peptidase ImmA (M78 family)